jgi:hypothetical protein
MGNANNIYDLRLIIRGKHDAIVSNPDPPCVGTIRNLFNIRRSRLVLKCEYRYIHSVLLVRFSRG